MENSQQVWKYLPEKDGNVPWLCQITEVAKSYDLSDWRNSTAFAICIGEFLQAKRLQRDVVYHGILALTNKAMAGGENS